MARPLINVPPKVKRGQAFEIKTLISHIMETGFRYTSTGERIPRDIVTSFSCNYNGEEIFLVHLYSAISPNPFIAFFMDATESGTLDFKWIGDNGFVESATAKIVVE